MKNPFSRTVQTPSEPSLEESLFFALMSSIPGQSWYSRKGADGHEDQKVFYAGINLPNGAICQVFSLDFLSIAQKTGAELLPMQPSRECSYGIESARLLVSFSNR